MALTDGFIAVVIALGLLYYYLYNHPERWVRYTGYFGIMIVGIGFGVIADTIPMFILMSVNLLIAGRRFLVEVGLMNNLFGKKSGGTLDYKRI